MLLKDIDKKVRRPNKIHNNVITLLKLGRLPVIGEIFYDLIKRKGSALKPLLEEYYNKVSNSDRNIVLKAIQSDPINLCKNTSSQINLIDYDNVNNESTLTIIEKLFKYFFKNKLNLKKHYNSLKLSICPYCTISDFTSFKGNYKEAYDHFFPISKYPYWGADMRNLSPMCTICNTYVKGNKVTIFDINSNRQEILFPYQELTEFEVKTIKEIHKKYIINIIPTVSFHKIKFENYIEFFQLQSRFEAEYYSTLSTWFGDLQKDYEEGKIKNISDFKLIVKDYIKKADRRKFDETSKFLEKSYYEYVYNNSDKFYRAIAC